MNRNEYWILSDDQCGAEMMMEREVDGEKAGEIDTQTTDICSLDVGDIDGHERRKKLHNKVDWYILNLIKVGS